MSQNTTLFEALIEVMELAADPEIIANGMKVIRSIFKDERYMLYVSDQIPIAINRIIKILDGWNANPFVCKEVFAVVSVYCSTSKTYEGQGDELHNDITDESI